MRRDDAIQAKILINDSLSYLCQGMDANALRKAISNLEEVSAILDVEVRHNVEHSNERKEKSTAKWQGFWDRVTE